MEIRRAFEVRVPPEAAFAYFSDPNRAFERFAPQYRVRWAGPIQAGTTFHLDAPKPADRCDGVVDDYEPPRRLAYRLWVTDAPDRGGAVTMEFEPTAGGTAIVAVMATHMNRMMEVAAIALRPWLAFQSWRGTKKLVRTLEAEYGTSPQSA